MSRFFRTGSVALFAVASLSSFACSDSRDKFHGRDGGQGGADADKTAATGGENGLGGATPTPGCGTGVEDLPDDDFEDSNCDGIDGDAKKAIFVSPDGDDLGSGTQKDPVATINTALSLAQTKNADVYICNGEYDREVRMEDVGINLYGGYDCNNNWKRVAESAVIRPQVGVPLTIRGVEGAIIERLVFRALDNAEEGGSSIAAVVVDSEKIQLRRVELESGQAGPGQPGISKSQVASTAWKGDDGGTCSGSPCSQPGRGGSETSSRQCSGGDTSLPGGRGGNGSVTMGSGGNGTAGGGGGGKGGVAEDREGKVGGKGLDGLVGAFSDALIGSFSGLKYVPDNAGLIGTYGGAGKPGGGGAGGSCLTTPGSGVCAVAGPGGGQGGSGGCGGAPGLGGEGGGASVGLVLLNSQVELAWLSIITGDGGVGGQGGLGEVGQTGGSPGSAGAISAGAGGKGGQGGAGGHGGPGGGGPSLGIALIDSQIIQSTQLQILLGDAGRGAATGGLTGRDGVVAEGYDVTSGETIGF